MRPFLLALLLAGCDGGSGGGLLDVRFERLDVRSIDWERVESDFVFSVDNPYPIGLSIARFDYALAFEGVEWATGDDPDGLRVEAEDSSEVALPVDVVFEQLYELVEAVRGEDTIGFELAGTFGFDTPAGTVDLPYDATGEFPALRAPKVSAERVRVDALSATGATLAVVLGVDNDLGSNLWFRDFDYALTMEGTQVAAGLVPELGEALGASTTALEIPVEIDFLDVGTAVYEAIASGDAVRLGIDASTTVETPFGDVPLDIRKSGDVRVDR